VDISGAASELPEKIAALCRDAATKRKRGELRQHALHNVPMHVSEAEVAAVVTVGELLVIEAEEF
jgi:hypothetical protein